MRVAYYPLKIPAAWFPTPYAAARGFSVMGVAVFTLLSPALFDFDRPFSCFRLYFEKFAEEVLRLP